MDAEQKPNSQIVFIVPPKVHLLDLSGPAHVFYEAKEAGAPLEVIFASFSSEENIESSANLFFSKLISVDALHLSTNDFIFIPGSEDILRVIKDNQHFSRYLQKWHEQHINLCSICVGIFWLAQAGLIAGKKSTTHWKYLDLLEKRYPATLVQKDNLFVIEENLYMSAGVSSGIDLSLQILEHLYGYHLTLQISKEIVYYFRRAGGDPQLSNYLKYRNHIDNSIHKVQDYIMNNLNKRFTLDDIAEEVNMSKRNLSRKFKNTTQLTIGAYIDLIRAERAKHLLDKGNKMETVARECG
ncbi:MAG: DJ-1/PfpI family protein, partial [Bacteroidota bacterium]